MREKIITEALESLRRDGIKFSVDVLAEKLKISKKTVHKLFPSKEALAFAMYETCYANARKKAQALVGAAIINEIIAVVLAKVAFQRAGEIGK